MTHSNVIGFTCSLIFSLIGLQALTSATGGSLPVTQGELILIILVSSYLAITGIRGLFEEGQDLYEMHIRPAIWPAATE